MTHWDETRGTLYMSSPALGRSLAVVTADAIGQELVHRMRQAGARAVLLSPADPTGGFDLLLELDVRAGGRPGVSAGYGWRSRTESQPLAAMLAASVAGAAALRDRGPRLSLGHSEGISIRLVVSLGPDPAADMSQRILDGIHAGLIRHWMLSAPLERLPEPVPEACAAAELPPPAADEPAEYQPTSPFTLPAEPDPLDGPRITLYPDPSIVVKPTPRRTPDMDQQARVAAAPGRITPPATPGARSDPHPEQPAQPTVAPSTSAKSAYPVLVTQVSNTKAALVIRGKRHAYFDPRRPPGDGPTVPFARERGPEPAAVAGREPISYSVPEAIPDPIPERIPEPISEPQLLQAPALPVAPDPIPSEPAFVQTAAAPPAPAEPIAKTPPRDPRRSVQVIQQGGTVIRLS